MTVSAMVPGAEDIFAQRRLDRERERSTAELKRIRAEAAVLDARLRDPAAQRALAEHALREKAGMARPGEIVYHIRPAKPARD